MKIGTETGKRTIVRRWLPFGVGSPFWGTRPRRRWRHPGRFQRRPRCEEV